jgi:CHAD domain-containing protein
VIEDEIKLAVHGPFALPDLVDPDRGVLAVVPAGSRTLRATYWDTADLRLVRSGVTLRHRTGEEGPPWQLKLPVQDSPGVREELAEAGGPREVPAATRALVTGWARAGVLAPVATLRTDRSVYRILGADEAELAELVDDTVSVLDRRRVVARFREVEVERRAADDSAMGWLRERLVAAGAVEGAFTPKVVHALGPLATEPGDLPEPPELTAGASAGSVVRYSMATGVRRLVEHDAPVRRRAPDAVHQMRVACRRLRSDLRTFDPLVDRDWAAGLREELSWLAGSLGAARDLEVLRERVARAAQADPLAPLDTGAVARIDAVLAEREKHALAEVEAALATQRYAALLERLVEAARHPVFTEQAAQSAEKALTALVSRAWRKLEQAAAQLEPDGPDEDWHQVRIRVKRTRYAAEAVAPALGADAKRSGAAAAALQGLLGDHQDGVVATETLLEMAVEHPDDMQLVLACGRLAERERADVRRVRAAFPLAWDKAGRTRNTKWLRR